jgi:protein-S-isoprenylcysteine O-methyltransferase Ste14
MGTIGFVLAIPVPTIVLVPWLLSGWVVQTPFFGCAATRWVGVLLIVSGPYVYVRNPMYIGVVATIAGQGLVFGSPAVLAYAAVVLFCFEMFVRFYEEPRLTRVFGGAYRAYCRRVHRWIPSLPRERRR